jgi:hypothetical protein
VSALDRVYKGLKAVMLMDERFDRIDTHLRGLGQDFGSLAASHAELAQRVASLEGYIRGRSDQAAMQPRLPER